MIINTNITAQAASHSLQKSQAMLAKSISRLSTGYKLVDATDDAAGMAVGSNLDAQINRINAAKGNVGNAITFTQTQDGYLKKVAKVLDRMSELAILAQDVTKSDSDRSLYNKEFTQLGSYITDLADKTFNGVSLFTPAATTVDVTVDSEGTLFKMTGIDLADTAYTDVTAANVDTRAHATDALVSVKAALAKLSEHRATVGSHQIRLSYTGEQLTITKENLTAASSRIQDVDMAEESTEFARQNILVQSGTAMLAQANSTPQSVLRLLQ